MTPLTTYLAQRDEYLKSGGNRQDMPCPLDAIDLLLALGTPQAKAAAERLAEGLAKQEAAIEAAKHAVEDCVMYDPDCGRCMNETEIDDGHDRDCAVEELAYRLAALREAGE